MSVQDCIITDCSKENLHKHKQRVLRYKKKLLKSPKVNYVRDFIERKIDYEQYLSYQHQSVIDYCNELFLFVDNDIFLEANTIIQQEANHFDPDKIKADIAHENEHLEKAKKHGCECYIGIIFNFKQVAPGRWEGNSTPTMVPFVEKFAIDNKFPLEKYLNVLEDIATVSNQSEGDINTLRTIDAMKTLI
jgi:hypothetical protein